MVSMTHPLQPFSPPPLSVTEFNHLSARIIEQGLGCVTICGEVSNLTKPRSGHYYFSLKDASSECRCVLFSQQSFLFDSQPLQNGLSICVYAKVSLYVPRGQFQIIVRHYQLMGEGMLRQQYIALKNKLFAEGLFDPLKKQPLPAYPRCIGIVTASQSAALQDMLKLIGQRYPLTQVIVSPSLVQGPEAVGQLIRAIDLASRHPDVQLIVLCRGGGSLEDLWCFNDELLARHIFNCPKPIVSAIGHEVDHTIADEVADLRAPTPSAAAVAITPDAQVIGQRLQQHQFSLCRSIGHQLQLQAAGLLHIRHKLQHPRVRLDAMSKRLAGLGPRLSLQIQSIMRQRRQQYAALIHRLASPNLGRSLSESHHRLSWQRQQLLTQMAGHIQHWAQPWRRLDAALKQAHPMRLLDRGYAVTRSAKTQAIITSCQDLAPGERIRIQFADGIITCLVESIEAEGRDSSIR